MPHRQCGGEERPDWKQAHNKSHMQVRARVARVVHVFARMKTGMILLDPPPRESGRVGGTTLREPRALGQLQIMQIRRAKLTYPVRWKAFTMGVLPRSVAARMRGTSCVLRIRVPSARISSM
ncbi:hypothetical protein ACVWXU_001176 [Streptomyces sp. TE33382]